MKPLKSTLLITLFTFFIFSISACSNESEENTLDNIIKNNILPAVTGFKNQANSLVSKTDTFCAAIDQAKLEALQQQWKDLSLQWHSLVMYNIGPLNDNLIFPKIKFIESMRPRGRDYTSAVRAEQMTRLDDNTVLDASYFDALNFTLVGMLALELLIFEDSISNKKDLITIVSDYQARPRKCEYLTGMAQLLQRHAIEIDHGWQVEFLATGKPFKNILLDGEMANGKQSVAALLISIQEYLDYLEKRKLDVNDNAVMDAQIANFFYENIGSALTEIDNVLEGSGVTNANFFNSMKENGHTAQVDIVKNNMANAKQAVAAKNRGDLAMYIGFLDGNFKREIPDSLGVNLGINFSDGD